MPWQPTSLMTYFTNTEVTKFSAHSYQHLIATNYVGLASYVAMVYDHLLTFSDEVELVWKSHKGLISYLFLLNRYFFPLSFIPNLYAYLSPTFSANQCRHFVRYEGSCALIGLTLAGLIMGLRVRALYPDNRMVQAILVCLWLSMLGIYAWLLSGSRPVLHGPRIHGCSLLFDPNLKGWATLCAAAPLVFDSAVVFLTIIRAFGSYSQGQLIRTVLEDGFMYYLVIFSTNLTVTIMIATAASGIKNILLQFAQLITVIMISRITLHLRKKGNVSSVIFLDKSDRPISDDFESSGAFVSTLFTSVPASSGISSATNSMWTPRSDSVTQKGSLGDFRRATQVRPSVRYALSPSKHESSTEPLYDSAHAGPSRITIDSQSP